MVIFKESAALQQGHAARCLLPPFYGIVGFRTSSIVADYEGFQ